MERYLTTGILLIFSLFGFAALAAAEQPDYEGRPQFRAGWDRGYYIWKVGEVWKVRWTTLGVKRTFKGKVVAEGGELGGLKRIDVEAGRKVIRPGKPPRVIRRPGRPPRRVPGKPPTVVTRVEDRIWLEDAHTIRFETHTDDDVDGFDFRVGEGTRRLRFTLKIDGKSLPVDVEIGPGNVHPPDNPFVLALE